MTSISPLLQDMPSVLQSQQASTVAFDERPLLCHVHANWCCWRLEGSSTPATAQTMQAEASGSMPLHHMHACWAAAAAQGRAIACNAASDAAPHPGAAKGRHPAAPANLRNTAASSMAAGNRPGGAAAVALDTAVPAEMPDYADALGWHSLMGYGDSNSAAELEASQEAECKYKLAGLPKLHASSLEVLCISGLLRAAQTDKDWAAVGPDTYARCVQYLAGVGSAWLVKHMTMSQPEVLEIPPLAFHCQVVSESSSSSECHAVYVPDLVTSGS